MRICLIGEYMSGYSDEGIHNWGLAIAQQLRATCAVRAIAIARSQAQETPDDIIPVRANRLFFSSELRRTLQEFDPDLALYISSACAKTSAFLRAKMLKDYVPRAKIFLVALQPVEHSRLERLLLPLVAPDGIFVQSPESLNSLKGLPCPVRFVPSGVDTGRFVPVDVSHKMALRKRYGVNEDALVVLHVGHINRNRNIQVLQSVAQLEGVQVFLVGSISTPEDEDLSRQLVQSRVRVVREYLPRIEEVYQLADVYLFPVSREDAAIGVPLSVLEAMACNLPVVTTRFGGLPTMFKEEGGLFYFSSQDDLIKRVTHVRELPSCSTRQAVEPYDWQSIAGMMLDVVKGAQ